MAIQTVSAHVPAATDYPELYDSHGRRLAVLDNAFAVIVTEILVTPDGGGQETIALQLPTGDPKRQLIENERRIRCAGSEFVIRQAVDGWDNMSSMASSAVSQSRWQSSAAGIGGAGTVLCQVTGEAAWYDLASCDPITSLALTNVSAAGAIYTVLQGTGWAFAGTDITNPNTVSTAEPTTVLAMLRKIQATWGGELQFDSINKTVGLWRQRGKPVPVVYAYGHNLAGNTRTLDTETLATRAWIYGAGGVGIQSANRGVPFIEDYSFFDDLGWERETRAVVLVNDQITDPGQLLSWGQAQLATLSQPKPTYQLIVAQLPGDELPDVGDSTQLWDSELDLRTSPRVARRDLDVLQPENTQLQLANALRSLPTATTANVGGTSSPVMSGGAGVTGGDPNSNFFATAATGTYPRVQMDATGVWAMDGAQNLIFNLSAITGILTATAVLEEGSDVPAPVITSQLTDQQLKELDHAKLLGQITTTQITDDAITTPKLGAGSVITANLTAFCVLAGNIASATITSTQIAANTIVAANIAASTITADRMNVGSLSAISANLGTVNAGAINGLTINGGVINSATLNTATLNTGTFSYGTFTTANGHFQIGDYGGAGVAMDWDSGAYVAATWSGAAFQQLGIGSPTVATPTTQIILQCGGSPSIEFYFNNTVPGRIDGTGFWGQVNGTSDRQLKTDIEPLGSQLETVRRLRGVRYRRLIEGVPETRPSHGLVAQEVLEALPELVRIPHGDKPLALDLLGLHAVTIEAIKDLAARVDELTDSAITGHPVRLLES